MLSSAVSSERLLAGKARGSAYSLLPCTTLPHVHVSAQEPMRASPSAPFRHDTRHAMQRCAAAVTSPPEVQVHTNGHAGYSKAAVYDRLPVGAGLPKEYSDDVPQPPKQRRAGVILHPTSLPGPYGIGELGSEARAFVDWLSNSGLTIWQLLPLVPPDPMFYSPYSGTDSNCGNPLIISIDELINAGLLDRSDAPKRVPVGNVDFQAVASVKLPLLSKAAKRLLSQPHFQHYRDAVSAFRQKNKWVEDSALFDVARNLPEYSQSAWWDWPEPLRFRQPEALNEFKEKNKQLIEEFIVVQYFFDEQWRAIKAYANSKGIEVVGDMPIYVGGHSADVWANQHLFELGPSGAPAMVSGVPPDCFSETGQLWGSPLFKWDAHKQENYRWWAQRLGRAMVLYDETRIDHFRGFAGYWAVDASAKTAMEGEWKKGPGLELFRACRDQLGDVRLIAEDLGVITSDVTDLRDSIPAPGMAILQFAWGGGPTNVHLPHNHHPNCFVYPGTHDNETMVGWYYGSATEEDKKYLRAYLGSDGSDIAWDVIRASMKSVAHSCVMMMQDIMRLDNSARMNTPGKAAGNWSWRIGESDVWYKLGKESYDLKLLAYLTNRLPPNTKLDL